MACLVRSTASKASREAGVKASTLIEGDLPAGSKRKRKSKGHSKSKQRKKNQPSDRLTNPEPVPDSPAVPGRPRDSSSNTTQTSKSRKVSTIRIVVYMHLTLFIIRNNGPRSTTSFGR